MSEQLNASTQRNVDAARRAFRRDEENQGLTRLEREDVAVAQERRQALVSEHLMYRPAFDIGHPEGRKVQGCPYCYAPGPKGDYAP